ncbi:MAG TPA: cupin domain-containing protein [Gaiellaceae bacterium]|nr:cupin domain-containing protein [Gaiellaceae bacterium]
MIAHWDDVESDRVENGHMAGTWRDLGCAAGSQRIGVNRVQVEPGHWSTPAHAELDAEEIFFVLAGSGLSWQDGKTYEIGPGDCIVHRVADVHTFRAGDEGLDLLAFGQRIIATYTHFPRVGAIGNYPGVTVDVSEGPRAWDREQALGEPEVAPPSAERPPNIVKVDDVRQGDDDGAWAELAREAGSVRTGLNWVRLPPGRRGAPPHCHSSEEEIFVALDGEGVLELWPTPGAHRLHGNVEFEEHELREGHVVSRPPATRIAHSLRGGDGGFTYLAYGTREPNDVCYYPRSNKIFWRGVGLIARLEPLDYDDGEPDD